tara:strand:+ start:817 stop:1665 length:849 start_codon:yes stop_codon:yes gene_type:complete
MAITIDRLSGGNTPADGSDPRTFPAIWNATAAILEANVGEGGGGSITVSPTPPTDPAPENGNLWWNSTEGEMYIYYVDGSSSQWVAAAGPSVTVAATAPTGYEGQLWLDSTDGSMYVYYTDPGGANSQWIGAVSRSGGILQVVSTTKTDVFSTTSTSYTDLTGLTATITPASASSKIMVFVQLSTSHSSTNGHLFNLVRGATNLLQSTAGSSDNATFTPATTSTTLNIAGVPIMFLDSPASASTQTYKIQLKTIGGTAYVNRRGAGGGFGSTSTITLMEVAG